MDKILSNIEIRVLGCLIEKELATPEYYPLTLNALTNACNQKSNRFPMYELEEPEVNKALDSLRFKQLAVVSAEGGRATKYRHLLAEKFRLSPAELAILAELLLRGGQTVGELRTRGERMHSFADLAAVEEVMDELLARTPPLVILLPRQPNRKESRYAHTFAGETGAGAEVLAAPPGPGRQATVAGNGRLARLEEEVASLRAEVAELDRTVEQFKAQFE